MPTICLLTEVDLRRAVPLDLTAIDCVSDAFAALATRKVVMPPVLSMAIPDHNGEIDVKTAYVPGLPSFAVKMSPGFFDNPKLGLPSTSGLMVLFSAQTGTLEALLLDNGYLTDIRTAAAGAVAAQQLARKGAKSAGILGAGMQARLQLKALALVRPIESARIWARRPNAATAAAQELQRDLGITVTAVLHPADAVLDADVVITTTPSRDPLLKAEWLRAGQHVTAMGSDQHDKSELYPDCLTRATLYVADSAAQTRKLGELRAAIAAGLVAQDAEISELGQVVAGRAQGRRTESDITIADLTGMGVQDTAIATLARQRAKSLGAGTDFKS
ncbi:MAG: ectoine utilization protein EutC [Paracoccaceae bacterium]